MVNLILIYKNIYHLLYLLFAILQQIIIVYYYNKLLSTCVKSIN